MCDNDSFDDMVAYRLRSELLSRRGFGSLSLGVGLASLLPIGCKSADPAPGPVPAPTAAASGAAIAPTASTANAVATTEHSLTPETEVTDAKALTTWLDQQPSVDKSRKMGTTGYCMSGPLVMRTAATNPDRIGAAATFHGGGLVTDKPDSPHLLIPKMKAHFLIAIAANDDAKQPDAKGTLKAAFAQASLPANVEVYEGMMHGWCPPDSQVYNRDAAEKAWGELLVLFKTALG
jgi:carboxymethylenebutenolidase